jgi:hypothetical protein
MEMTEAFASAVAVSVPIFALAAGAEARGIRERLSRPDPRWERDFAAYNSEHELDLGGRPAEIFAYLRGVPGVGRLYKVERVMAIGGAVIWLAVFVLLGITELRCLVWLADGEPPGGSGLASFALVSIGAAMLTLIMAPVLYFLVPLGLTVDLIPAGLKAAVGQKLADKGATGFFKQVMAELEGAVDRTAEKYQEAADEKPEPPAAPPGA